MPKKKIVIILLVLFITSLFKLAAPVLGENDREAYPDQYLAPRLRNAVVLYTGSSLALADNSEKQVDPANLLVTPVVIDGRTLVPARFISENMEAQVAWDASSSLVTITSGNNKVEFSVGSSVMKVNGLPQTLEAPAQIINQRTFVPLRAISEALDKKVFYDRGLIVISEEEAIFDKAKDKAVLDALISRVNNLPAVGSYENLQSLLAENASVYRERAMKAMDSDAVVNNIAGLGAATQSAAPQENTKSAADADFSATNVQVEGVDEADLVKTDGDYIYQVNRGRVVVVKARPAGEMRVVNTLEFNDSSFHPRELFLDDEHLVVIGDAGYNWGYAPGDMPVLKRIAPIYTPDRTKALIYSIASAEKIEKVREIELKGHYVSSRKIGSALYLVANDNLSYRQSDNREEVQPAYKDSVLGSADIPIPFEEIRCLPPVAYSSYLLVAGLDLSRPDKAAQVSAYLGAGEDIYVSSDNLYVAVSQHPVYHILRDTAAAVLPEGQEKTLVYKFSLNRGKATYLSKGEVPGTIINQFSMDEDKGYFRIATTTQPLWGSGQDVLYNNLYVLDDAMNRVGQIEKIAPGEKIYATRFLGERAYMVTFKTVDPLFVLDLHDPGRPRILGSLKIPGYSDYLHPYDETHILGFGKDTVEVPQKDSQGRVRGTNAYYLGLKVALFDVSDVEHPREMYTLKIGDRGTESELLQDHKALLFNREKGLLAFPVTLYEASGSGRALENGVPPYGSFSFQGEYVYSLDLVSGFAFKGRITHLDRDDYLKAGYQDFDRSLEVKRSLYSNDVLYTLSEGKIKANSLEDLKEIKAVEISE